MGIQVIDIIGSGLLLLLFLLMNTPVQVQGRHTQGNNN